MLSFQLFLSKLSIFCELSDFILLCFDLIVNCAVFCVFFCLFLLLLQLLNLRGHAFLVRLCLRQVGFDLIQVHHAKLVVNIGHFCLRSQDLLLLIIVDAAISSFLRNRILAQLEEFDELLILKANLLHLQDNLLVCPVQAKRNFFLHLFVTEVFGVNKITRFEGRRAPVTTCSIYTHELLE